MNFLDKIDEQLQVYPKFRKEQVYNIIFAQLREDWDGSINLPKELVETLRAEVPLTIKAQLYEARNRRTTKAVIELDDGMFVETVLMKTQKRNTVCVSTQVGCPMGCQFCESGRNGFKRNLTVGEIAAQVLLFQRILKKQNTKVTNVVFMGMGEPLLNYDHVLEAITFMEGEKIFGLSARKISISTSGIVPGIKKLSSRVGHHPNLAISLHSAIDEKRSRIMPVNKKYHLDALAKALSEYFQSSKRKIMFEYLLVNDLNTSEEDAAALRSFLDKVGAAYVVNIIPLNKTSCDLKPPTKKEIVLFKGYLDRYGINYVQRFSFGQDIEAACGQLVSNLNK